MVRPSVAYWVIMILYPLVIISLMRVSSFCPAWLAKTSVPKGSNAFCKLPSWVSWRPTPPKTTASTGCCSMMVLTRAASCSGSAIVHEIRKCGIPKACATRDVCSTVA